MADCQEIADEIATLKQERSDLQADLHGVPGEPKPSPSQKAFISAQIKELTAQIDLKEEELRTCLGLPPALPAVACPLTGGTTTITTSNSAFPGPFLLPISPTFTFLAPDHTRVDMAQLMAAIGPVAIPSSPCSDTLTVTIPAAGGSFTPTTGDLSIAITAVISHSLAGGFLNFCAALTPGPSTATAILTTAAVPSPIAGSISGAPLNRTTGQITLVASGTLVGGAPALAGTAIDLRISGVLGCLPLP